jgi:RNA polymerase sigma factor (sigma-70 family)
VALQSDTGRFAGGDPDAAGPVVQTTREVQMERVRAQRARAARAGDPDALDALVAEYLPLVYTIVRRSLRRSADVDDVVQDTMLRVVRGVGTLRDPDRMRAWLVAVTVNQIREHHRSAPAFSAPFDEHDDFPDPGGEFVGHTLLQLDVSAQRRETQQAARWLDADQRELLALWWLEASGQLSRPELIEALRADPHHAAVRVSRMKEQLDTARRVVRALAATPRCPGLEEAGRGWRGETDSVWRKRFARHVRECRFCDSIGNGLIPPERLLAGLALLPLPAAYAAFRVMQADTAATTIVPATDGDGDEDGPARHHRGSHRAGGHGGRGGAKGAGGLLGKPVLVALAAVGILAVAAAAVVELRPGHQNSVSSTLPTVAVIAPSALPTASVSVSALTFPSDSASSAPSTSTRPSSAPPSRTAASSAPAAPPPTSAAAASSSAANTDSDSPAEQVLAVINKAREQAGLAPYTMSDDLIDSASAHNTRMEDGCGLSHQCSGEPALGARETAAGVQWTAAGENIGDGGPVDDTDSAIGQMAVGLTNSMLAEQPPDDGHRLNILSSSYTEVGIAVTRDSSGTVWMTQDFAN